ncbi:5'-methylthioadenosine/adenosylhomocysteine nucleosidase [Vagococcus carniphilus]|uniref:5'-methylthioadenosine/S-adenosylhomocysteine nucleosidase n=1 Tax=Vagococcus carniphilus TaxID=218144 RepID=A0A430AWA8_9ENTE|nr:5'-methylthioadenosine/adenosylhomocysteine nucleosidase [Vagococcus carniphilus]QNN72204.1 5'-methylthioadenosine/adenosylhomocysteine nucleosidase [Vagococcus carniphilus]RSU12351.1 5'-methylthioadenosine/S-adenosylhomocysteine nucleosidase [Vagococcus carniphilus]
MKIGIIGAMEQEVVILSEKLENMKTWEEAGANFYSGTIGEHEVVLTRSGIGKTLAALTTTLLISHYHVDAVINTGSAGGIGDGLSIGDIVISNKVAYSDVDVTAFGYEYGQMAQMPLYYEANESLIEAAMEAASNNMLNTRVGLIVSGDTFVSSQKQISDIKSHFPDCLANEMEGAAIAHVAYQYSKPFVVIRAMSDVGDENASVNFDEFIIEAGEKSAKMVLALLSEI